MTERNHDYSNAEILSHGRDNDRRDTAHEKCP